MIRKLKKYKVTAKTQQGEVFERSVRDYTAQRAFRKLRHIHPSLFLMRATLEL